MSPLDAARRLLEANESGLLPSDADGNCWYCYWHLLHDGSGHDSDCPWPALPQIVAALEAAERLESPVVLDIQYGTPDGVYCRDCGAGASSEALVIHAPDCAYRALVAALKREADAELSEPIGDHLSAIFSEAASRLDRGESAGIVPAHPLFQDFIRARNIDGQHRDGEPA